MLQMNLAFFNFEIIRGFTSTFVAIGSATSHPFEFPNRSKRPPIQILEFVVTVLRNEDKKISFILVDEDGALERSSGFMNTSPNINIKVQATGGDASSLNGKS